MSGGGRGEGEEHNIVTEGGNADARFAVILEIRGVDSRIGAR